MNNKTEPKILPGFMELLPSDQLLFNKMYDTIRNVYERYGFLPLDTPIIELSEILLAKAGGETEKQIYRFVKGDTDLSLRFDLTVPLARYVAQRYNDLVFPFKRYQMGKVYRGERPQRGRFREFYQCDIDVIGNETLPLLYDAEMPAIIYTVFKELRFNNFTIKINNRKILNGFFEFLNLAEKSSDILRIIDKIEKIGQKEVIKELKLLSINENIINTIIDFISIKGSNEEMLKKLKELKIDNESYILGINELENVVNQIKVFGVKSENYSIDLTIARGLDYYTGTVYETILNDYPSLGSVCSGGRFEDLATYYTNKKLPGVGISIGLTRLFYQLREAKIIKSDTSSTAKVIVIPMENTLNYALKIANLLRENKIPTDISFIEKGIKQKLQYANRLGIPYAVFIGEDEQKTNTVTVKNMNDGIQKTLKIEELITFIKELRL